MPVFDPYRILEAFVRHDVEFVVIGGIAVQAHAIQRITVEVDFAVAFSKSNRERIAAALAEIDARMIGPEGQIASSPPSADFLAAGDMWLLQSRFGKVDVIAPPHNPGGFEGLRERAVKAELAGMTIPIASVADLIDMKRVAGRPQDLADIELLESLQP